MNMVDLHDISGVGNGLYRMSVADESHFDTLNYAIRQGYNLIDTSSNYLFGDSELLVGKVIKEQPKLSQRVFIISKAGYVSGEFPDHIQQFLQSPDSKVAHIDNESSHCIHRAYIKFQFEQSLDRIGRPFLDCYLVHNPERYLKSNNANDKDLIYDLLEQSFGYLEQQIEEGKLRYYGISSNKVTDPSKEDHLDIEKIISIARKVKRDHHFKFLQIPFNFLEQEATQALYRNERSVLEIAKAASIKVIGNRPFNMDENGKTFQLLDYSTRYAEASISVAPIDEFYKLVDQQISLLTDNENGAADFQPMVLLKSNWNKFYSIENTHVFWNQYVDPFIDRIFESRSESILSSIGGVKNQMQLAVYQNITSKTSKFLNKMKRDLSIEDLDNVALTTLNYYLKVAGLDHVLVGMRRKEYIADLNGMFATEVGLDLL